MNWFKRRPAITLREPHARPQDDDALLAHAFTCSTCGRTDLPETGDWDPPICQECDAAINEDAMRAAYGSGPGWQTLKVTLGLDPDIYRTVKVEAARSDRSVRDVVAEAITGWLERHEEDEDRASAALALEEYRRDGGVAAADFLRHLAAEARTEYGSGG